MDFCEKRELQGLSLKEFMKRRKAFYFQLKEVRPILHQVAAALSTQNNSGLAHTDLTPENIKNMEHFWKPLNTKLTDTSSATSVKQDLWSMCYKAPEIILGLPRKETTDVWSLGCIAAELFLGFSLYSVTCEHDVIWSITQIIGELPEHLLSAGPRTNQFYVRNWSNQWKLMTPAEYRITPLCLNALSSLDEIKKFQPTRCLPNAKAVQSDVETFIELIKQMLHPDPEKRLTPSQVLQHPFLTMQHLMGFSDSYVQTCSDLMDFCYIQSSGSHQDGTCIFLDQAPKEDQTTWKTSGENQPTQKPSEPDEPSNQDSSKQDFRSNRKPARKRKRGEEEKLENRSPDSTSPKRKRIKIWFNPEDDPNIWKSPDEDQPTQQPPEQGQASDQGPPLGEKDKHIASPEPVSVNGCSNNRNNVQKRKWVDKEKLENRSPDSTPSARKTVKIGERRSLLTSTLSEAVTDNSVIPERKRITVEDAEVKPQRKEEQALTSQCGSRSSASTAAETPRKEKAVTKIWLIGSSYIRKGEGGALQKFGENLGLNAKVEWFGKGGLRWSGVLPRFYSEIFRQSPPDILVVHAGGNDLGLMSAAKLKTAMQRDLKQLHKAFPQMKILLSSINERQKWRHGTIDSVIKDRQIVNTGMRKAAERFGGVIIEHPLLRHYNGTLYLPDGVHFTRKGNSVFISRIRAAIMETLQQMSL